MAHNEKFKVRNIPACAGKTYDFEYRHSDSEEHPRVRGENMHAVHAAGKPNGTSPRARGKQIALDTTLDLVRNIPACAGKTSCVYGHARPYAEHPRVRGENAISQAFSPSKIGTSPRARGKRHQAFEANLYTRNIPACAGKTYSLLQAFINDPEHPRVRGENR